MTKVAGSAESAENTGSEPAEETEQESVAYSTYKKALDQRKADRDRARELQAKLDAVLAEKEDAEKQRLADQAKYKELYEGEKKRAETIHSQLTELTAKQVEARKREALKSELGGVKKDEYLKFADLSAIAIDDDGTVDVESVRASANKFREAYPELVSGRAGKGLPNEAPRDKKPEAPRPLTKLSEAELRAKLAALNTKK